MARRDGQSKLVMNICKLMHEKYFYMTNVSPICVRQRKFHKTHKMMEIINHKHILIVPISHY